MSVCEKWPNMEFCCGAHFLVFRLNRRFTPSIFIFIPNTGKYRQEKSPYLDIFTQSVCKNFKNEVGLI